MKIMSFKEAAFSVLAGFLKCLDKPILDFLNRYKILWNYPESTVFFAAKYSFSFLFV